MPKAQASSAPVVEKCDRNLPPTPPGYLLFQLRELQHQPIEYLSRLWQEYGDLVRLPIMPGFTLFFVAHPDHAEHILSTHQDRYRKPNFFLKPMGLVQGQGLFTSEGELWLKHRRLMQPAFHQKQLVNLQAVMLSCVQSLLSEWAGKPDGALHQCGMIINFSEAETIDI